MPRDRHILTARRPSLSTRPSPLQLKLAGRSDFGGRPRRRGTVGSASGRSTSSPCAREHQKPWEMLNRRSRRHADLIREPGVMLPTDYLPSPPRLLSLPRFLMLSCGATRGWLATWRVSMASRKGSAAIVRLAPVQGDNSASRPLSLYRPRQCCGIINAVIHNGGIEKNGAGAIRQATVSISKKPTVFRIPTSGSTYLPINGICNGFDEMGRVLQGERTGSATAACPRRSRTG